MIVCSIPAFYLAPWRSGCDCWCLNLHIAECKHMCECFNTLPLQSGSSIWSRQKMAHVLVTIWTENKILNLQVWWKNLLPVLSLYSALHSQLAGSYLAFLSPSSSPSDSQYASKFPCLQSANSCHSGEKIKKIPGKAEATCPVGKGTVTKWSRVRGLTEFDPVCDYNYILIGEMLNLKI